jgi:hypothetical protein
MAEQGNLAKRTTAYKKARPLLTLCGWQNKGIEHEER